jgi:hypothetical protein
MRLFPVRCLILILSLALVAGNAHAGTRYVSQFTHRGNLCLTFYWKLALVRSHCSSTITSVAPGDFQPRISSRPLQPDQIGTVDAAEGAGAVTAAQSGTEL